MTDPFDTDRSPDGPAGSGAAALPPGEHRPLFGTVVWGLILLAVAAVFAVPILYGPIENPSLWIVWGVAALGFLLLAAGVAAVVRRARSSPGALER